MAFRMSLSGASGLSALAKDLIASSAALPAALEAASAFVASGVANIYLANLRRVAPVRSGKLRDSLAAQITAGAGGRTIRVSADGVGYLGFVVTGTRPHPIAPKKTNGVLVFPGQGGGMVFARLVNHPGTKPNDFPGRAWQESNPAVRALLSVAAKSVTVAVKV